MDYEYHEYANIFPLMEGQEFEDLKKDIKEQGLLQPIVLCDKKILDGRNRYRACKELKINPDYEYYTGKEPLQYVISLNLKRRHLNESQRVVIADKIANMKHGGNRKGNQELLISLEQAGKTMKVSPALIKQFRRIKKEAPSKIKEIELGNISVGEVISEMKVEKRRAYIKEQRDAIKNGTAKLPKGKYEVIVIDPPWMYGQVDDYSPDYYMTRVANPYPEMSIEQIKALDIPSSDNCVLWLWTTHKYIFDCRDILESWGFRDVSILTWVKDRMGIGKWLRSQTEYCIMAVKGKPTINLTNQTTVLMAKNLSHSQKPKEFYKMVDELCIGRKLDYFARDKKEGWDCYGIQAIEKEAK